MAELLESVGSGELTEWAAFALLEPFGAAQEDYRAGLAPAATINVNRSSESKPISALDFFPGYEKPEPKPEPVKTPEEIAADIKLHVFGIQPEPKK